MQKVVVQASEFKDQELSRLNGDHDWACAYPRTSPHTDVVQTYIRGEKKMYTAYDVHLLRELFIIFSSQLHSH